MGELSVLRRNREMAVPQYQKLGKTEKRSAAAGTQRTASRAAVTVSETLRQLMGRVSQADRQIREGRRTLQSGEAALAEVEDSLSRMEKLARQAAGDGKVDRGALQSSLEQIRGEIERIAQNGIKDGLFQDGGGWEGLDALVDAVMDGLGAKQDGVGGLPAWLLSAAAGDAPDAGKLLAALGLDASASGRDILAALGKLPLSESPDAGYLATIYLGTVIAGGTPHGAIDPELAAAGLGLLLSAVADGELPDEALARLTGGAFTSLADFEAQFTAGTAPGLEVFLTDLLLNSGELAGDSLLGMLAGGGDIEALMDLLAALGGSGDGLLALLDGLGSSGEGAALQGQLPDQGAAPPPMETEELGDIQAAGRDLSGVALDGKTGALTLRGEAEVILRGLGREAQAIRLTSPGAAILQQVEARLLSAEGPQTRIVTVEESALAMLRLEKGSTLTVDGGGLLRIGSLRAGAGSVLRLVGGTVVLTEIERGKQTASVVVDGPVSLLAPAGVAVRSAQGQQLSPFDILWKTMLPEWSSLTSLALDGRQGRMALSGEQMDLTRLWLLGRNNDKDYPAHSIVLRGRDRAGRPTTQYIYVRWDEKSGGFQQISMYPNPFTVTGGEPEVDWRYEEESQTLTILTAEVTAVAGGRGMDANQVSFSGRLALAHGIGMIKLELDGVECRVAEGRAFYLGRGNAVTLLLRRETVNVFESGAGFAGVSLGDGTSLCVGNAPGDRSKPEGRLTATAGSGGAGIGRDSSAGQEPTGAILIRGGVITATGTGGGAGIGGALGAAAGDIRIQGGTVTAQAACCAAAIGAGIQGGCGDIMIAGSAKVAKAQGGGPDGDIGGCLFGNCGKVEVSAAAQTGGAKLWTQKGLSIQVGEASVTLPKFRVSARALRLDGLSVATRESARAAITVLATDRRWVTRLQGAYGAMYGQLGQSFSSMYSVQRYTRVVRDADEAKSLSTDIREVLRQSPKAVFLRQRGMEDVAGLLRG